MYIGLKLNKAYAKYDILYHLFSLVDFILKVLQKVAFKSYL